MPSFISPFALAAVANKFSIYATPVVPVLPEFPPSVHSSSITIALSLVPLHTYFPLNLPSPVNDTYALPFVNVISHSA